MTKRFLLVLFLALFIFTGCKDNNFGNDTETLEIVDITETNILSKSKVIGEDKITIGDKDQYKFKPELKIEKWEEQALLRIYAEDVGDDLAIEKDGKIKWNNSDKSREYNFYELDDGFEFDIILNQKPKENYIKLKVEAQNLVFYYQPPLTEEFKNGYNEELDRVITVTETDVTDEDGNIIFHRPEDIVGSYAIYHITKHGGLLSEDEAYFKNGKFGHLKKPILEDSNGWKVYGNLRIENGEITVTPEDETFFDKATYPIKRAAGLEFGYNTAGGSNQSINALFTSTPDTPASAGTVSQISGYIYNAIGAGDDAKVGLWYEDGVTGYAKTLIGTETEFTDIGTQASADWMDFTGLSYSITADPIWFGWQFSSTVQVYYDSSSPDTETSYKAHTYADAWPSSNDWSAEITTQRRYSWYAVYTASGGAEERKNFRLIEFN